MVDLGVQIRLRVHINERNVASCSCCLNRRMLTFTKAFTLQKGEKGLYLRCALSPEEAFFIQ